jgi:membrane protease YdiL (CAAX protease family)
LGIEAAWSLPLALLLCWAGGLVRFGWTDDPQMLLRLALVALVAPALGEELLFRVLLLPPRGRPADWRHYTLSVALFVLWHLPQAWLFGPHWAVVVLNPCFLAANGGAWSRTRAALPAHRLRLAARPAPLGDDHGLEGPVRRPLAVDCELICLPKRPQRPI